MCVCSLALLVPAGRRQGLAVIQKAQREEMARLEQAMEEVAAFRQAQLADELAIANLWQQVQLQGPGGQGREE